MRIYKKAYAITIRSNNVFGDCRKTNSFCHRHHFFSVFQIILLLSQMVVDKLFEVVCVVKIIEIVLIEHCIV